MTEKYPEYAITYFSKIRADGTLDWPDYIIASQWHLAADDQLDKEYREGFVAWVDYPHPARWQEVTEERFDDALGCLPPIAWIHGKGFLIGEASDHHPVHGFARYTAILQHRGKFYESMEPLGMYTWKNLDMRVVEAHLMPMKRENVDATPV